MHSATVATSDGAPPTLAHDDVGAGAPVVWLHGFPHDRALWTPVVERLKARARCLVPDLPGFGASPLPAGALTLDAVADAVVALLDAHGIARAAVCGLSMGGYVALALWRRHPGRVSQLILCDTRATADPPEMRAKRDAAMATAERDGAGAVADGQVTAALGRTTRAERPEVVAAARAMMARQSVAGIVAALRMLRDRPDQSGVLPSIAVPCVAVVGDEDAVTPPAEMEQMTRMIPGARLVRVAGAGHLTPLERPEEFIQAATPLLPRL